MDDSTSVNASAHDDMIGLAVDVVSAYVSSNTVPLTELPGLIQKIYAAIDAIKGGSASVNPEFEKPTAAQIKKSITPDALISFIDGKAYKTLKRHLNVNGLTIEQYRQRYGLPRDYPSVAASYSEQRSALAKSLGLGRVYRKAATRQAQVRAAAVSTDKRSKVPGRANAAAPSAPEPTKRTTAIRSAKKLAGASAH